MICSRRRLLILFLLFPSWAAGDYLDFHDGSVRQYGFTVVESRQFIELEQIEPSSGKPVRQQFSRDRIKSHVKTVDPRRLEALVPGKWVEYRDYAEELASLKIDPVARQTAIRLFAICIANADPTIKKSAAANLPALASASDEQRRFEAIAFLYGNQREINPVAKQAITGETKKVILELVQLLRREEFDDAADLISRHETKQAISVTKWLPIDDLNSAISARRIPVGLRVQLIRLESQLIGSGSAEAFSGNATSFADSFNRIPDPGIIPLSVTDGFPFDLMASKYRNGKWVRP